MPELVYKRAGHLELFRYRDGRRFLFNGVVQSLVPSITKNTTELEDGNSDWPHVFSTGMAGSLVVNLNSFQPRLYAALVTAEYEEKEDLNIRKIEDIGVPAASPYTVSLARSPATDTLVIVNENDSPFVKVSSDPDAGEYAVTEQVVEFSSADKETHLVAAYDVQTTKAQQLQLPEQTNDDVFRVTIAGNAVMKDNEAIEKIDELTFDRMRAEGEIAMPTRQREPQGWNFTMRVLKPRAGFKVVDYKVEE